VTTPSPRNRSRSSTPRPSSALVGELPEDDLQRQYIALRRELLVAKQEIRFPAPHPDADISSNLAVVDAADRSKPSVLLQCCVTTTVPPISGWAILCDALALGYFSKQWLSLGNSLLIYDERTQLLRNMPMQRNLYTALRLRLLVIFVFIVIFILGPAQIVIAGRVDQLINSAPLLIQVALMIISLATFIVRDIIPKERRYEFNHVSELTSSCFMHLLTERSAIARALPLPLPNLPPLTFCNTPTSCLILQVIGLEQGPLPSLMPLLLGSDKPQFMLSYAWGSRYLHFVRHLSASLPDCWIDANKLSPGDSIPSETVAAARHARVVIHFVTCEFVRSQNCVPEICTSIRFRRWPQITIVFVDDEDCNCREGGHDRTEPGHAPQQRCKFVRERMGGRIAQLMRDADPRSMVIVRNVYQLFKYLDEHVLRVTSSDDTTTCVRWWQVHGKASAARPDPRTRVVPPRIRKWLWYLKKRPNIIPWRAPGAVAASFRMLTGDGASIRRFRLLSHHEVRRKWPCVRPSACLVRHRIWHC